MRYNELNLPTNNLLFTACYDIQMKFYELTYTALLLVSTNPIIFQDPAVQAAAKSTPAPTMDNYDPYGQQQQTTPAVLPPSGQNNLLILFFWYYKIQGISNGDLWNMHN